MSAMIVDESSLTNDWNYLFKTYSRYMDISFYETGSEESRESYPWICLNKKYSETSKTFMEVCLWVLNYQYNFPQTFGEVINSLFKSNISIVKLIDRYNDPLEFVITYIDERQLQVMISVLKNYELLVSKSLSSKCWDHRPWCHICGWCNPGTGRFCDRCYNRSICKWIFTYEVSLCSCREHYYEWVQNTLSDSAWINRKPNQILGDMVLIIY